MSVLVNKSSSRVIVIKIIRQPFSIDGHVIANRLTALERYTPKPVAQLRTRKFNFVFNFFPNDDAITEQMEVMKITMMQLTFTICCLSLIWSMTDAYPVESKPLNNNPESWNFGDGWNFNPRSSDDPATASLIGSDPHIKKSKITPKSIFIAPNSYNDHPCPHGFRIDDNKKCIKVVTIDQDEVLKMRISELFGIDENQNKNSDTDNDYYDFDDETKTEKDSGPLQISLPLAIDIEETIDGKKVEYVIEEKVVMRNLDPKNLTTSTTTEKPEETTTILSAPVTEITESVLTEEPTTIAIETSSNAIVEETTMTMLPENSTTKVDDEVTISTVEATTVEATTTTEATTTIKTTSAIPQVKIFSVDFLPKSDRKSNRLGQASARFKNSQVQEKIYRPRKQKTTALSTKTNEKSPTKLYKIDRNQVSKKNRTRMGSKRPGYRKITTTTEEPPVTTSTTPKPFWWLPKGWTIDETREKPVLVRFWSKQPLPHDDTARSHGNSRQRANSRMPSENIFREITPTELDSF